jgi:hypothetical protein
LELGTENRKKAIVAGVLMVIAVIVIANAFFGGSSSPSSSSASTATSAAATSAPVAAPRKSGKKLRTAARSLDPTLRFDWLKASEDMQYEGNGRNIFRADAEIPKPIVPVVSDQQAQNNTPPPPPPPPPINLKFFGFANKPGEPKKVFLSQGDDVFIAREGDIVDRRYRIVRISPNAVEVEDVLNNNRQSIPLTQG